MVPRERTFRARATVKLTLEVEAGSVWDSSTSMGQIAEQATREVREKVRTALDGIGFKIVDEPKVVVRAEER